MPLNGRAILEVCQTVAEDKNMRVTFTQSAKGGLIAGIATVLGGLAGGRQGLMLGALCGGAAAYMMTDEYKPVAEVIKDMPENEQRYLIQSVRSVVADLDAYDAAQLLFLISGNVDIASEVIQAIVSAIGKQGGMVVMD